MKTAILAASVLALALSAGPTLAAKKHAMGGAAAEPKQPIPYSELNAYLKASPKQRATRDWWSGASTGMAANTTASSTAGADPASGGTGGTVGSSTSGSAYGNNSNGADVGTSTSGMPPTSSATSGATTSGAGSPNGAAATTTPGATATTPSTNSSTTTPPPPQ
ncbi:MAG: hypothetical protein JF588_23390 [Caulobacterales bacterium]|nr:hypothetical protein [Caulobacterales bacterium]